MEGNCAFPQNFHTKKSGEITVFFLVLIAYSLGVFLTFSWGIEMEHWTKQGSIKFNEWLFCRL